MTSTVSCKMLFLPKFSVMISITYESVISHIFEIIALILVPTLIIGCIYFFVLGIYRFFKGKTKKELSEANAKLLEENSQLKDKNAELSHRIEHLENEILQKEHQLKNNLSSSQLINFSSVKLRSNHISYITSDDGNSRIKVFHYTDNPNTDSVYAKFDDILAQLDGNFMQINKHHIINLLEIDKIQGDELYLKNVKNAFLISDTKREEFDERISKM